MAHKLCFETVDRFFRDLMRTVNPDLANLPFGGKVFVIGGDFRQTMPVVLRGTRADIINASIKSSYLWHHVQTLSLTINMRLNNENNFDYRDFLINIGNGSLPTEKVNEIPDYVNIPDKMYLPLDKQIIFDKIYDDFANQASNSDYLNSRAILCPLNKDTDEINDFIINLLHGDIKEYLSIDFIDESDGESHRLFATEYLNSLNFSGLPPHILKLKLNQPVILMRNISNSSGLCNGTRFKIICNYKAKYLY